MQESSFHDSVDYTSAAQADDSPLGSFNTTETFSTDVLSPGLVAQYSNMLIVALLLLLLAIRPGVAFAVSVILSVFLLTMQYSGAIALISAATCSKLTTTNIQSALGAITALASMLITTITVWFGCGVMALAELTTACRQLITIPAYQKKANVVGCILFSVMLSVHCWSICSSLQAVASLGFGHLLFIITFSCQTIISSLQAMLMCCQCLANMASAVPLSGLILWMDYLVTIAMLSLTWVSNSCVTLCLLKHLQCTVTPAVLCPAAQILSPCPACFHLLQCATASVCGQTGLAMDLDLNYCAGHVCLEQQH